MTDNNTSSSDQSVDTTMYRSALENSSEFESENDLTLTASELSFDTLENTTIEERSLLESSGPKTKGGQNQDKNDSKKPLLDEVIIVSSEDESEYAGASSSTAATVAENPKVDSQKAEKVPPSSREIKIYDSLEEFDKNLPPTVKVLSTPHGSKVYLVGTAHFSEESQYDVSLVIRNIRPQVILVELCGSRIHILNYDEETLMREAKELDMNKVRSAIQSNGVVIGLLFILMLNISAKLTEQLGMVPGGEFRRALEEARKIPNCVLHLGDRPINITLRRSLHGLSLWQTVKLIWRLLSSDLKINQEEVESCKHSDFLEKMLEEMAGDFPSFQRVFVHERDLYLCHSLQLAATTPMVPNEPLQPINVVGIVGIGHSSGIIKNWGKVDSKKISEILVIPPPTLRGRVIRATIKYGFLGAVSYGVYRLVRPILPKIL